MSNVDIMPSVPAAPAAQASPTPATSTTEAPKPEAPKAESQVAAQKAEANKIQDKVDSGQKITKAEEKKLKEYKLKINGKEEVIKFDPNNDEEVIKHLQRSRASDQKFAEAAELRKAAMEFINELKANPKKVLTDPNIGIDVKKFAEQILNEQIAELEKTPEQREREKLQKELEELKAQAKEKEEKAKKEEFERLQAAHEKQLETDIMTALDVGGLPKTPRTVKAMAEMMMIALQNGVDLSARDIAPIIKNTTLSEFKEIVQSLSDDQLEDFLGREVLGRLRKKNVAKAKAIQTANSIKQTGVVKKEPEAPKQKMTIKQFLKV